MRAFLDTNVIAYALDARDVEKRRLARHLLRSHAGELVISTQVLIELFNVCVRALKMSDEDARARIADAAKLDVVSTDRALVAAASDIAVDSGLTIFDSMLAAAAIRAGCETLLTEDAEMLAADIGLTTANPFE